MFMKGESCSHYVFSCFSKPLIVTNILLLDWSWHWFHLWGPLPHLKLNKFMYASVFNILCIPQPHERAMRWGYRSCLTSLFSVPSPSEDWIPRDKRLLHTLEHLVWAIRKLAEKKFLNLLNNERLKLIPYVINGKHSKKRNCPYEFHLSMHILTGMINPDIVWWLPCVHVIISAHQIFM